MSITGAIMRDGGRKLENGEWEKTRGDVASQKPHGRLAWSLYLGHGSLYLDVSVMPRKAQEPNP